MPIKQLAHVCIFARDLDATKQFYTQVLGLDIAFNFTRDGRVFGFYLHAGGRSHIEVFENAEAEFDKTNRINHLCLEVTSLDEMIAQIRGQGVEITDKSLACDDTWQAWTADPNGTRIELFEYTDKSAQFVGGDRVANW
ncbi:lactoylglutathione lyase [Actibacterium mucosum KCTC 23349]|uniref:Lactoylglutathione lyase n=1 Tax=Actibacterium mucosum KCTC 23349 TaxID=1454373 RepID=A0A037ZDA9_9RHOB|nr:VOC family protein [Actibacterium mucosum]KAJ54444.1 lactoylglutathione lyase [Actibacterium mucosum KCTC 23349]